MYPRVTIAGISGDSGKTLLSCGLVAALKEKGYLLAPYKKGPDYIDPAWLSLASGATARNLDTFLMDRDIILKSFLINSDRKDISVIEGNRGLYDGMDAAGSHSTATLAKLLKSPVVLIFNISKMTGSAAAIAAGCKVLDKDLMIRGIVLNQTAGSRHRSIAREAIETETGIPVLGAIPKLKIEMFPSRHLGLIMPGEYAKAETAINEARKVIEDNVDIDSIIELSNNAPELVYTLKLPDLLQNELNTPVHENIKIGYFYDKAFSFYYEENLEALRSKGADLIPISSIDDRQLPDIDGLYIGGGFPESNAEDLTNNSQMLHAVKQAADAWLPIYAECGGLIYLADTLDYGEYEYNMSGVLPITVCMKDKPQGHGYAEVIVDKSNPYFPEGMRIRGHEFHYSVISKFKYEINTCFSVKRGTGAIDGRDGIFYKNTFAAYTHMHALATPEWAEGLIALAKKRKYQSK